VSAMVRGSTAARCRGEICQCTTAFVASNSFQTRCSAEPLASKYGHAVWRSGFDKARGHGKGSVGGVSASIEDALRGGILNRFLVKWKTDAGARYRIATKEARISRFLHERGTVTSKHFCNTRRRTARKFWEARVFR
jgi:hypothetical protein